MKLLRALVLAAPAMLAGAHALPQEYPTRPITLVVPTGAGGAADTVFRLIGEKLSQGLKQRVIIENRPGANSQLAAEHVARAAPDGYTLLVATNTSHSANPSLYKHLRYDPIKDFTPIIRTTLVPFVVLVNSAVPAKNISELVSYAKANPGKISYAYAVGTSLISSEMLRAKAGIDIVGVPYRTSPQALTDLIGGRLEMFIVDIVIARSAIDSGEGRPLAVTTATKSRLMPEVPPIAETLPGVDIISWAGIVGPAEMPKPIVDRLSGEIYAILTDLAIRDRLEKSGYEIFLSNTPAEFGAFIADQLEHWALVVKQAGIQPQ